MPDTIKTPEEGRRAAHLGPERRRPQILDAALAIAVRDGLGAVTFGRIATELSVTRPVVYSCFGDRVELMEALLHREAETLTVSAVAALHASGSGNDAEAVFAQGFKELLASVEEHRDTWRLLLFAAPDPAVATTYAQSRTVVRQAATDWIGPAMRRWWNTTDLDRKLPVLVDLFMAACESGIRSYLDGEWSADELGDLLGRAVYRAFAAV